MCSCCITCSTCKQGRLVFPVACLARHLPRSAALRSFREEKEEMKPASLCVFLSTYMCFCENVSSCVGVCLGSGVDVGLWREGGSATALTDFQAPPAEPQTPASPLCSPLQKPMPDSTQHPRNKHKLPLFSSTWLAVVVQDVW